MSGRRRADGPRPTGVPAGPAPTGRRRRPSGPAHRGEVRPRWGRISALSVATLTTVVALLAGAGAFSSSTADSADSAQRAADAGSADQTAGTIAAGTDALDPSVAARTLVSGLTGAGTTSSATDPAADPGLPPQSGQGRRIVFDQSDQRVWLVDGDGTVERTYLVSGSKTDNLQPGHYDVVSRQPTAIGVDDSGTMTHFVVFTYGKTGAGIGFHDIPVKDGKHIQTQGQLGTPLSHGCIRQKESDAVALWDFAPLGTRVVVTA